MRMLENKNRTKCRRANMQLKYWGVGALESSELIFGVCVATCRHAYLWIDLNIVMISNWACDTFIDGIWTIRTCSTIFFMVRIFCFHKCKRYYFALWTSFAWCWWWLVCPFSLWAHITTIHRFSWREIEYCSQHFVVRTCVFTQSTGDAASHCWKIG